MRDKTILKILAFLMFSVMVVTFVVMPSSGDVSESDVNSSSTTIYVPDDYSTIQWAVDNATAGDKIIVKSGTYYENVKVNKRLTLRGVDTGRGKPVVKGGFFGGIIPPPPLSGEALTAITLSENGITLDNFYATCSGFWGAGIHVSSNNNTITNNTASYNFGCGIDLYHSNNNTITNNTACNNARSGVFLSFSSNNTITNNTANNCYSGGIRLFDISSKNTITDNTVRNNGDGITLVYYSSKNTIANNTVRSNHNGISFDTSSSTKIYFNNFINNNDNVYSSSSTNIWNSPEKLTYTYKSNTYENYLGNYWDDYNGTDADGDGIGDSPYSIDGDKDNYPLMVSFENYLLDVVSPSSSLNVSVTENIVVMFAARMATPMVSAISLTSTIHQPQPTSALGPIVDEQQLSSLSLASMLPFVYEQTAGRYIGYEQTPTLYEQIPVVQKQIPDFRGIEIKPFFNVTKSYCKITKDNAVIERLEAIYGWNMPFLRDLLVQEQIPIVQEQIPIVHEQIPVVQEQIPIVHEQIPVVQEQIPIVHEQIPIVQEQIPIVHEQIPIVQEQIPIVHEQIPVVHQQIPIVHQQIPIVHEQILIVQEQIPIVHDMRKHQTPKVYEKAPIAYEKAPICEQRSLPTGP